MRKCGFTHASRAEIRIFTPRDIKFRTILVRKNVFLTSVITTHSRQKTFHRTRIVMYYFVNTCTKTTRFQASKASWKLLFFDQREQRGKNSPNRENNFESAAS